MRAATLASETDFDGWRKAARALRVSAGRQITGILNAS